MSGSAPEPTLYSLSGGADSVVEPRFARSMATVVGNPYVRAKSRRVTRWLVCADARVRAVRQVTRPRHVLEAYAMRYSRSSASRVYAEPEYPRAEPPHTSYTQGTRTLCTDT